METMKKSTIIDGLNLKVVWRTLPKTTVRDKTPAHEITSVGLANTERKKTKQNGTGKKNKVKWKKRTTEQKISPSAMQQR